MSFPQTSHVGEAVHLDALRRLAVARDEQRRRAADAEAAAGAAAEEEAARSLSAAKAEVAAREAWVGWVEHGV